MKFNIFVLKS